MPAGANELPRMSDISGSQDRFYDFLTNFNTNAIAIGGPQFPAGVAAPNATGLVLLQGLVAMWDTTYGLLSNKNLRTAAVVAAAKAQRFGNVMTDPAIVALNPKAPGVRQGICGILREYIRGVQGSGVLTPGQLASLGLTVRKNFRSLPQIPLKGPELTLDPSTPHTVIIRYHQEGHAETSKAKPFGCKGCLLKWQCANGSSGSMMFTKTPCVMDVGQANTGQGIRISGTWVMGNSKESPPGNTVIGGVP